MPGPKPVGDEVVGPALGPGLGQRALVGGPEAKREHRSGEHEQDGGASGHVRPRVFGHVRAPTLPARRSSAAEPARWRRKRTRLIRSPRARETPEAA